MPDDEGRIYITISNRNTRAGGVGGAGGGSRAGGGGLTDSEKQWNYVSHRFANFLESEARQLVNYSIGNIGNFSGNYQSQREIQNAVSILGMFANVGMATFAGARYGIPGAIAGFAISTISQGINIGLQEYANMIQFKKQNYNIDMLRKISGLDTLSNGSRSRI